MEAEGGLERDEDARLLRARRNGFGRPVRRGIPCSPLAPGVRPGVGETSMAERGGMIEAYGRDGLWATGPVLDPTGQRELDLWCWDR